MSGAQGERGEMGRKMIFLLMDGDGIVEWGNLVVDLEKRGKEIGQELRERRGGGRKELDERVERLERELLEGVKRNKSRRKWGEGKKRWWTGRVEKEYRELREVERRYERGGGDMGEVREKRREFKKVAEEEKREHWVRYLEGLGEGEGFKWVKGDRDFVVDIPTIVLESGERLEKDEEKGWE